MPRQLTAFIVGVLAFVIALATVTTAQADPTGWKQKQYFDAINSELRLTMTYPGYSKDCDWKGPPSPYFTSPDTSIQPLDWTDFSCPTSVLWAKTCKPGRQTVTFNKTIYLPGGARNLDVSLVSFHDTPLSMALRINDVLSISTQKSVHKRELRGDGRLFKVGQNKITVTATKPKTGKPCNTDGTDYGISMQLRAVFPSDIRVSKIPAPSNGKFDFTLTVTNAGPSRASTARIGFGAYTSNLFHDENKAFLVEGPGVTWGECLHYYGFSISCEIEGGLDVGETKTYRVRYSYKDPGGPVFEEWDAEWYAVGDLIDPKQGNNRSTRKQGVCRPARPPQCVAP